MPTSTRKTAPAARVPLQERGQRRVDAILDAAAVLVARHGVAGVTVHGVAREARTAIGSMYHFFPDLEAVLAALEARHVAQLAELLQRMDAAAIDWGALSTAEAVGGFLDPVLDYVERHPDLLHVTRRPGRPGGARRRNPRTEALLLQIAERIVCARDQRATSAQSAARAATMLAIVDGVLTRTERTTTPPASTMTRELKRALVAYLASYERD
jgi:AcrR family transcriptional regulator